MHNVGSKQTSTSGPQPGNFNSQL